MGKSWNPLKDLKEAVEGILGTGEVTHGDGFAALVAKPDGTPQAPTIDSDGVVQAGQNQRRKYGRAATMLTGGMGLTDSAPTVRRTLLGE